VQFDDDAEGVAHVMATNREVCDWGGAGLVLRSQRRGVVVHAFKPVATIDGHTMPAEALEDDVAARFQGRVLFDLKLAEGERVCATPRGGGVCGRVGGSRLHALTRASASAAQFLVGSLPQSWKVNKWDYASVGEVVEVVKVNLAVHQVKVRFIHRQRGNGGFDECYVPRMVYEAWFDGAPA